MSSERSIPGILMFFTLASMVSACVYDFHPEISSQAGFVVIEGDILIGERCTFDAYLSTRLEDRNDKDSSLICQFRVEASDGTTYLQQDDLVDLREAEGSLEYRLVADVSAPFSGTYASRWAPVEISPPIDELSWSIEDDEDLLWVNVSTHSEMRTGFYRWSASETYEYHATYYADHFFVPAGTEYKGRIIENDSIVEYEDGDNSYFCWTSDERSDILIGNTTDLTEDRLVGYQIYSFLPTDRKVSHIYFVELKQRRLTEDAYLFWDNLRNNSTNVGGLFSPEPFELRGNISNVNDPDEFVLGYVSVTTLSKARLFIDNYETRFSRWTGPSYGNTMVSPLDYRKYYGWQYRVGWFEITSEGSGWIWLPKECVDCRVSGGTKERPSWWINDDK